jgi:ribosomal protein S27AE
MKYVKVCPKCSGRIRIHHSNIFSKMGFLPTTYKCEKCGYVGKYFLEVPINELEKHRKLIKKNVKRRVKRKKHA